MTLFLLCMLPVFFLGGISAEAIAGRKRRGEDERELHYYKMRAERLIERANAADAARTEDQEELDALRARLSAGGTYRDGVSSQLQRCVTCGRRCPHCARGLEIPDA